MQNKCKTTLRNDDQEMQKKGMKNAKEAACQKECISKSTKITKGCRKKANKTQNIRLKKYAKQQQQNAQTMHQFHTPPVFVRFSLRCLRVLCAIFVCVFRFCCILFAICLHICLFVPKETHQKWKKQKTTQKDRQSKDKQTATKHAKAIQNRTFLFAFVLLLFCAFACICCALFKRTIAVYFLLHVVCILLHSNASLGDLFLRFLYMFCSIGFALLMFFHVLLCHQN